MRDTLRFANDEEAIEALGEFAGARIIIAKGIFDRIKDWVKEKWTGFRDVPLDEVSSAISMIRYNKKGRVLEVVFKNRGTYQYSGVPDRTIEQLLSARSKGKFFNKKIKDRYNYKRIASQNRKIRIASQLSRSNFVGRMLSKQGMCEKYESSNHRRFLGDNENSD